MVESWGNLVLLLCLSLCVVVLGIKIVQELRRLKCYVYKFLSRDNAVMYIGKTKRLRKRMEKEHFTLNGHLGMEKAESKEEVIE